MSIAIDPFFYTTMDNHYTRNLQSGGHHLFMRYTLIRFNGEADRSREQILSFAKKAEYLGYDSLSVNDHIVFRNTSWLDAITTLSAVAAIT